MRVLKEYTNVTLQEVPGHISLNISVPGCGMRCPGCHSPDMQDCDSGEEMSDAEFESLVNRYGEDITCITFFGGENEREEVKRFIEIARKKNKAIHTCLYTGRSSIEEDMLKLLDFVKLGGYDEKLGGLNKKTTNQRFYDLRNNEDITHLFWDEERLCL